MILEYASKLAGRKLVLASASPRRKELLMQIGLRPTVHPSAFAEDLDKSKFHPDEYALHTAMAKARDVAETLLRQGSKPDLIITCMRPTAQANLQVVQHQNAVLEKPADADDAQRMLTALSGSAHMVHTGVALVVPQAEGAVERTFVESTTVHFDTLTESEIQAYIATGSYFNVMGFPLHTFASEVKTLIEDGLLKL
eukprot:jgi/Astpho2/7946/Aster-06547